MTQLIQIGMIVVVVYIAVGSCFAKVLWSDHRFIQLNAATKILGGMLWGVGVYLAVRDIIKNKWY